MLDYDKSTTLTFFVLNDVRMSSDDEQTLEAAVLPASTYIQQQQLLLLLLLQLYGLLPSLLLLTYTNNHVRRSRGDGGDKSPRIWSRGR